MKLFDLLTPDTVIEELKATTKEGVIREMCECLAAVNDEINADELFRILMERESLGSTGIGDGVAIPHGKYPGIKFLVGAFGRSRQGVEFDSMDGKPAHLFFLLVAPENSAGLHLKALARISRIFKVERLRKKLLEASTKEEIIEILQEEDERA
ncbi:MAG: PTS sugar transporter subunit IIA [Deltaproteobacteria bacterium]|nr:MAG: PTS sugar transporter subunit IIA [Deltaproteobacteria bacterium]